ncbi:MAG: protein kinase [Deltaproteobacteria bacterium]|nr:protein kinase [Deltaproteobacteria bacterium]
MRRCPSCARTYPDELSSCTEDGQALEPTGVRTLADVPRGPRVPWSLAVSRGVQLAQALHRLVQAGRALPVLTPVDVELSGDPEKVLVTLPDDPRGLDHTAPWASPEALRQEPWTAASSVYNVACILRALLVGSAPFEGQRAAAIAVRQLLERPRPPRELRPDLPERLDALVVQALDKAPEVRPQSLEALAVALESIAPEEPSQALPRASAPPRMASPAPVATLGSFPVPPAAAAPPAPGSAPTPGSLPSAPMEDLAPGAPWGAPPDPPGMAGPGPQSAAPQAFAAMAAPASARPRSALGCVLLAVALLAVAGVAGTAMVLRGPPAERTTPAQRSAQHPRPSTPASNTAPAPPPAPPVVAAPPAPPTPAAPPTAPVAVPVMPATRTPASQASPASPGPTTTAAPVRRRRSPSAGGSRTTAGDRAMDPLGGAPFLNPGGLGWDLPTPRRRRPRFTASAPPASPAATAPSTVAAAPAGTSDAGVSPVGPGAAAGGPGTAVVAAEVPAPPVRAPSAGAPPDAAEPPSLSGTEPARDDRLLLLALVGGAGGTLLLALVGLGFVLVRYRRRKRVALAPSTVLAPAPVAPEPAAVAVAPTIRAVIDGTPAPATGARCARCGALAPPGAGFCPMDGEPVTLAPRRAPSSPPPEGSLDPFVVGQYRCVERIGEGGMGVVYRAQHLHLDRPSAVKVLLPRGREHAVAADLFRREARLASLINHPNSVTIYDFGEVEGALLYLAMELVSGRTLAALLREGPLPMARALPLVAQVCDGLDAAHGVGVVHRDLKPHNLMVAPRNGGEHLKILDFGIARSISSDLSQTLTGRLLVGTPPYMAPEQARGEPTVDTRADVFSLGVVTYEMLAAQLPFPSRGLSAVEQTLRRATLDAPPVPLREALPSARVPETLDAVLAQAMAVNPDERFQSAGAFYRALATAAAA